MYIYIYICVYVYVYIYICIYIFTKITHPIQVKIVREQITWPGARIRKKNEGMPNYENNNHKGVLFITFDVVFPKKELSPEHKKRWFIFWLICICSLQCGVNCIQYGVV